MTGRGVTLHDPWRRDGNAAGRNSTKNSTNLQKTPLLTKRNETDKKSRQPLRHKALRAF